MESLFKKKTLFYTFLILTIVIIVSAISVLKLRINSYGLPPLKPLRPELIHQGDFSYLKEFITAHIRERMQQTGVVGLIAIWDITCLG